jgi:5-methylcytosine-specific restriction endonuclease McrA
MSNGGYRPGSGRKKGSIPWNKGKAFPQMIGNTNGFVKGQTAWNKDKKCPTISEKMMGNTNGKAHKGRIFTPEWREKLRQAKLGKPSNRIGSKLSLESRLKMSVARRNYLAKSGFNYSYKEKDILRRDRKATRRERIKKYGGLHSNSEWENLKKKFNFTCPCCKISEPKIKLTRDHILPLSIGGNDNIENIQPLCMMCNSKKHTQTIKY